MNKSVKLKGCLLQRKREADSFVLHIREECLLVFAICARENKENNRDQADLK